jgi:hypothetical protein
VSGLPIDVAVSGLVIGRLVTAKGFIWSLLLTCVILRLVGSTGIGATFLPSLWTDVVANWVQNAGRTDRSSSDSRP